MKITCSFLDVCLPDYFRGHHKAHIQVPVSYDTTYGLLKTLVEDEIKHGYVVGHCELADMLNNGDECLDLVIQAIADCIQPPNKVLKYPFRKCLEKGDFDCYAYFLFELEEE